MAGMLVAEALVHFDVARYAREQSRVEGSLDKVEVRQVGCAILMTVVQIKETRGGIIRGPHTLKGFVPS